MASYKLSELKNDPEIYKYHPGRKMYSPVKVFYETVQEKEE